MCFLKEREEDCFLSIIIENYYNFQVFQKVTKLPITLQKNYFPLGFVLYIFIRLEGFCQMATCVAVPLAYRGLGFIMSLVPKCLEISLCRADLDTVIPDGAAISTFLTYWKKPSGWLLS